MNKVIVATVVFSALVCAGAQTNELVSANVQANAPSAKAAKRAAGKSRSRAPYIERRHGGYVRKAGSAYGKVVFLNAQKRVPREALGAAFKEIDLNVHPIWTFEDVEGVKLTNPKADIAKRGGNVGVVLGECADLPALVVAPEEGWAVVNVAMLAEGTSDAEKIASRVRKELLRAFALAGGASFMARGAIVMRGTVRTAKELDSIPEESYGVDALMALENGLPNYGVMPWRQTTYKRACREGWAPQPTNEYQRAIWNDIRQIPNNPIKIEFDPAKGK